MTDIQAIISGLERRKTAIDAAIQALKGIAGQPAAAGGLVRVERAGTRTGPAEITEGRQRQIEAMRRYWAQKKAGQKSPAKAGPKGGITAEGRKRLAAMMRKRWAAKRAAAKASK